MRYFAKAIGCEFLRDVWSERRSVQSRGVKPVSWQLLASAFVILAATIAPAAAVECLDGAERKIVADLLFGRNIGNRVGVSDTAWTRFVDREVTPRFPDGFTVVDGRGQWRDSRGGRIIKEPSKILIVALSDPAEGQKKLAALIERYKTLFKQESVVTILREACVSF